MVSCCVGETPTTDEKGEPSPRTFEEFFLPLKIWMLPKMDSRYVTPSEGDYVVRHDPHGDYSHLGVGILVDVDSFSGGMPRGHVLFEDGTALVDCLFLFQSPAFAYLDPDWS